MVADPREVKRFFFIGTNFPLSRFLVFRVWVSGSLEKPGGLTVNPTLNLISVFGFCKLLIGRFTYLKTTKTGSFCCLSGH